MNEKSIFARQNGFHRDDLTPPTYVPERSNQESSLSQASLFRTKFACVSLHMTDRIRLLRFPPQDTARIRDIIQRSWAKGIQDQRPYDASQEYKLHGNPWSPRGWSNDQRTDSRKLVCGLLEGLFDMGYILKASVDISKKEFDKDSLLFRLQQPPPPPCIWMSISFDQGDLMRLINAPQDLGHSIATALGPKVQRTQILGAVYEIKLRGYPWRASGKDTVQTRELLLVLLECLEEHGFSLYASIDQENGPGGDSHATEADTWFCNRQADWTQGAPIYHN